MDFSKVFFTDKSQVTFDESDGWAKGWILFNSYMLVAKRRQQGGRSMIIWVGIVDQTITGSLKVSEVKLNSTNYCNFIDNTFFVCYNSQSHCFKVKCVFMHDNAPSHVSKLICEFFEHGRFTGEKIIEWLPSSLDLKPIKNQWSIIKIKLYESGKQNNSKADL